LELGREKKTFLEIGLQLHPACGKMSTFKKFPTESTFVKNVLKISKITKIKNKCF